MITGNAKLDFKMDYMVVRKQSGITKIYIGEIAVVLIESTAVSLTAVLLAELVKHKVKVIFCDEKHNPSSELTSYYGSHDTSIRIRQQIEWQVSIKDAVWTEIVREKIKQQRLHLLARGKSEEGKMLEVYIREVVSADATNREGHAAKVYFNALFGKSFTRSEDNLINAALNYGYGVILSCFNREIVSSGYITQLGLFHDNMFNPFNLASDLMEPFRILVDRCVYDMQLEKFEHEEKMELVDILNESIVIGGKSNYAAAAIRVYCRSVFEALNERDISLLKFYRYEL